MLTRISTYLTPNQKSNIDLGLATAFLFTTCYYVPSIIYPLLGVQAFKLTLHSGLSYLKGKNYIGLQFHKSVISALDPTWAAIHPYCILSPFTSYFSAAVENDIILKNATELFSYAPDIITSHVINLTINSAPKLALAFSSGVISPIVSKTLDRYCNFLNSSIEKKFNPGSPYLSTTSTILTSVPAIFLTQLVSEYATPYGCFIKGLALHLSMHAMKITQPNYNNLYSIIKGSTAKGIIYAATKSIAAALPLPAFLPETSARLEIYYASRRVLEELLIWGRSNYLEKFRSYIAEENFIPQNPYFRNFLKQADFISSFAILAGATYSLCSSDYLLCFAFSNFAHLVTSYSLKSLVKYNLVSKDAAAIFECLVVSSTICMSFSGFFNNLTSLTEGSAWINYLGVKPIISTILVGGIPTLCFGLIGKVSDYLHAEEETASQSNPAKPAAEKHVPAANKDEQTNSPVISPDPINSILCSTLKELVAHYAKYCIHLELCKGALYGAALGGAAKYLISYFLTDKKSPEDKFNSFAAATFTALGAANHTIYQLIKDDHNTTNIFAFFGIEACDTIIKIISENYYSNKILKQSENVKVQSR